jgi:hypothetical protein
MGFNGRKSRFGYASCIQYIPNSDGKSLVSVGASGLYYSMTVVILETTGY